MNKSFSSFVLGLLAGMAAGFVVSAWLNNQNFEEVQEKFSAKADNLRDELADQIETLKQKLESKGL